jgi:TRAP-type transport system small permease protein
MVGGGHGIEGAAPVTKDEHPDVPLVSEYHAESPETRMRQPRAWTAPGRHLEELVASLLLLGVVGVSSMGVFNRYVLSRPLAWTEPLARYLLVWLTFFGAAVAVKKDLHMSVELFTDRIPPKVLAGITALGRLAQIVLFAYLAYFGWAMVEANTVATTVPGIRRSHVLLAVPLAAVSMVLHSVRHLRHDLRSLR